ncbi:hypothetical protein [Pseudophaeobacter leonis]|uniref:hypothetical protein n=1 Tax=Pseudophaeobacter leonis TaxID=1144477 RepID=UPI0009F638BE|nr:hypothetical protein [Pseudophaeobacter leonis]
MGAIIGSLRGLLSLESAAFESGAKRGIAAMGNVERRMVRMGSAVEKAGRKMALGLTLPMAGAAVIAVKSSLQIVDAQAKMAQSLGTSVQSMQVLQRAADLSGVSIGEVEQATIQLTKRLSQAAGGAGPAVKALEQLHLSAAELSRLRLDERLAKIQNAIADYVPVAERGAVASELFGSRAGLIFTRIDSSALRVASADVQRFGVAISEVDADQIERTNDAISRMGLVGRGVANQLTVALAPFLEDLSGKAADAAEWFNNLSDGAKALIAKGAALTATLGPVAIGLGLVLKLAAPLVGAVVALASPIGLAVAGFTALALASTALADAGFGSTSFAEAHEIAMDNVTIAMGDQIHASARLADALRKGGPVTLAVVEAKMAEANARRAVIEQLQAERREAVLAALGYGDLLVELQAARAGLDELAKPSDKDLVEMPALMAAGYEAAERNVVRLLLKQAEMLKLVQAGNVLTEEEAAARKQNLENIAELKRRLNELNGITSENVALTDRGTVAAGQLAQGLGVAAGQAAAIKGYLTALPGALAGATANIAGIKAGIAALAGGGNELTANAAKYRAQLEASLPALSDMADGQRRVVEEGINQQVQLYEQEQALNAEYQKRIASLNKVKSAGGAAAKSALAQLTKEIAARRSLLGLTDDQRKKLEAVRSVQQKLGKEGLGLRKAQIEGLANEVVELDRVEAGLGGVQDQQARWSEQITRVAFEGGSLTDTGQGMLRDIAYQFAHSKIVLPVVASVTGALGLDQLLGGGGSAGAALVGSGGGGGGLGLLGSALNLAGGGGIASGIGTGLGGGFSGGGLTSSFANLCGLISGTSSGLGAIGAALPGIGVVVAGIALLAKGLSRKYAGSGIRGNFGAEGFEGAQFDFYKGGFLRSNRTDLKPLEAEFELALDQSMTGITAGLHDMADVLNLSSDAIDTFVGADFQLWTNGKNQEEIQAALAEQLELTSSAMAELILGEEAVARAGETATDKLTRLSTGLEATTEAFDLLGHSAFAASILGGDAASHLVDQFGRIEAFSTSVLAYWNAFYSDAERQETTLRGLAERFEELGVAMPKSREEFRAMIEAIDLTSEAGRALYAELIQMSGAMNEALPALQGLSAALSDSVAGINGEVSGLMAQARDTATEAARAAQDWVRAGTSLRDLQKDLSYGSTSLLGAGAQVAAARAEMDRLSAAAREGDVDAAKAFGGVASRYLTLATSQAGSLVDAQRIAAQVGAEADRLAGLADIEGAADTVLESLARDQLGVLEELSSYLQSAETIDQDVIASFERRLLSLQGAIEGSELSLDFLRNGITLSIDELDLSSLTPELQELIRGSRDALQAAIEFVLSTDGLTPELRWLALQTTSQHTRTISLVPDLDGVSDRVLEMAIGASSDLVRNVELAAAAGLDPDLLSVVLAENGDLTRSVNLVLGSDLNGRSMRAALGGVDALGDALGVSLDTGVSDEIRAIVAGGASSYSASLDLAVSGDLAPGEVRALLASQRQLLVGMDATINGDLPEATQELLLNAITNGTRALAIDAHFGDQLTDRQRELLAEAVTNAERVVEISAQADLSEDDLTALRGINTRFERIMDGRVDLTGLSDEQAGFFVAISGATSGRLTLGGSFEFDPLGSFADSMQDAVGTPIDALSGHIEGMTTGMQALVSSLGSLQSEISADRARAEAAAEAAARVSTLQAKVDKFDDNWGSKSLTRTEGLEDKLQDLVASTGVSLSGINLRDDGTLAYSSSGISGTASQLAAFRDAGFWDQGGLQDQIAAANDNRQRAVAYQERLQENIRNAMTVPGFASGGDHLGGWRVVGEKGWELENTGPSRVVSNSDSKAMLDNRGVVAVLQEVLAVMSAMGASTTKGLSEVAKHTADLAKLERGREILGQPPTRQEV